MDKYRLFPQDPRRRKQIVLSLSLNDNKYTNNNTNYLVTVSDVSFP